MVSMAILKSDIEQYMNWIWMEVSGPIEHYMKKYNGFPLPNYLAAKQLSKSPDKVALSTDCFHYSRVIGSSGSPVEKVIFGFRNDEIAQQVLNDTTYEFKRAQFNMTEAILKKETIDISTIDDAVNFADQLEDWFDEGGKRDMSPAMRTALDASLVILNSNRESRKYIARYIKMVEFLRDNIHVMTPFKLKSF